VLSFSGEFTYNIVHTLSLAFGLASPFPVPFYLLPPSCIH
jgi:hypothetical protein